MDGADLGPRLLCLELKLGRLRRRQPSSELPHPGRRQLACYNRPFSQITPKKTWSLPKKITPHGNANGATGSRGHLIRVPRLSVVSAVSGGALTERQLQIRIFQERLRRRRGREPAADWMEIRFPPAARRRSLAASGVPSWTAANGPEEPPSVAELSRDAAPTRPAHRCSRHGNKLRKRKDAR